MKNVLTVSDAITLLMKYYPKPQSMDQMSCPVDGGDGSASTHWDIIDLTNEKLLKVNDFFDSENMNPEYEENEYTEVQERDAWGDEPTVIYVNDLVNLVLAAAWVKY